MMNRNSRYEIAALLLIAAGAGCANQEEARTNQDDRVANAVSALQGAVAICAEQRTSCATSEAGAGSSCDDSFASCRAAAQADNAPDLDRAVGQCAEASRVCREAAQTAEAKTACAEQLKSCVGEDRPLPPSRADADSDRVSPSPVAECIAALRTCIEGDAPARECTTALRGCVMAAVGNSKGHDGGKPEGPGDDADAATPERPDSGAAEHPDAGRADDEPPPVDAGMAASADAAAEAMACKAAYGACLAGGESRETCARMNKDCRE
jgi:hypothetical protein